jgi:large subunit ribosomal protein L30
MKMNFKQTKQLLNNSLNVFKRNYSSEEKQRGRILFVKLIKSQSHQIEKIQNSIKALKLRKIHQTEVHRDTPTIRGLIYSARNLLEVRSIPTQKLFPQGIDEEFEFKTNSQKKFENYENIQQMKEKKIEKLTKFIDHNSALKYGKLRKSPSKNKI